MQQSIVNDPITPPQGVCTNPLAGLLVWSNYDEFVGNGKLQTTRDGQFGVACVRQPCSRLSARVCYAANTCHTHCMLQYVLPACLFVQRAAHCWCSTCEATGLRGLQKRLRTAPS
jgi:hypothetical protein